MRGDVILFCRLCTAHSFCDFHTSKSHDLLVSKLVFGTLEAVKCSDKFSTWVKQIPKLHFRPKKLGVIRWTDSLENYYYNNSSDTTKLNTFVCAWWILVTFVYPVYTVCLNKKSLAVPFCEFSSFRNMTIQTVITWQFKNHIGLQPAIPFLWYWKKKNYTTCNVCLTSPAEQSSM